VPSVLAAVAAGGCCGHVPSPGPSSASVRQPPAPPALPAAAQGGTDLALGWDVGATPLDTKTAVMEGLGVSGVETPPVSPWRGTNPSSWVPRTGCSGAPTPRVLIC